MTLEHPRERARLEALESYDIIGSEPEESFDRIARLAASLCECPIALVSFVDEKRQWFKAKLGLEVEETPRDIAFCAHAVREGQTLVVENAQKDERFARNPLVLSAPHVRFYAGVPFFGSGGLPLGTVCVIDRKARALSDAEVDGLSALAREVEVQLSLRRALRSAGDTQDNKALLVALLAHDLRSPLQVAMMNTAELAQHADPERREVAADALWALQTMQRMVVNLLDLSSARDDRLPVSRAPLQLNDLVGELETYARSGAIHHRLSFSTQFATPIVYTDRDLVRRIVENLLGNAFKYAPAGSLVRCELASDASGSLTVRVSDEGSGIPVEHHETIFDPHTYLRVAPRNRGASYGLGLAFCRMAASALGGRIWVEAGTPAGAVFCASLPASDLSARDGSVRTSM